MSEVSGRIRGLEQVGGLRQGGDPGRGPDLCAATATSTKRRSPLMPAITPAVVRTAMQQWLRRPALTIILSPGEREAYAEAKATPSRRRRSPRTPARSKATRQIPPVGQLAALDFPDDHPRHACRTAFRSIYAQRTRCRSPRSRWRSMPANGRRRAAGARLAVDDHGPARRRHVEAELAAGGRGRGAARRRRQHQQRRRPLVRVADRRCRRTSRRRST